ncbi:MAG TPA: site-2 protease family protein, partial [Emticicia sp.]
PVGLAQWFGGYWNWERFWNLTGLLSMGLAFMNALPIPALDGGHVVVLLYEMITRRKPSEKFMERTQQVGTFILLTLMVLVLFNDTFKALFK